MKLLSVLQLLLLVNLALVSISSAWSKADMARMANVTAVRLVNGKTPYEGRVEVYINSQWGTVCDDGFDLNDARVICRQLGYGSVKGFKSNAAFGRGTGKIWLDDLECTGSESSLSMCFHNGPGSHNCYHGEDVGVMCTAPVNDDTVRLMSGIDSKEGRVEIFHNGKWGTVCDDFWDIRDAQVVCRELGFGRAVEAKSYAHFGIGEDPIWLDDVECTGSEKRLKDCNHNGWGSHNCVHHEDAGVVCASNAPVHGGWSTWTTHSCSKTCGNGIKRKSRTCTNPSPLYGGNNCQGSQYITERCNLGCCPGNGRWSSWVSEACSASCGGGTLMMTRTCTSPAPSCGGRNCTGLLTYTKRCNTQCCPVDGGWSNWTMARQCSKTCGGGILIMKRSCNQPRPLCGGHVCSGRSRDIVSCNTQCCQVDGGWTNWTRGECSAACGGGTINITRSCTNPAPSCNGSECAGGDFITAKCNMHCCPAQKKAVSLMFGSTKYEGLVQLTTDDGPTGLVCNDEDTWSLTEANIVCMQLFGTSAITTTSTAGAVVWDGTVVLGNVTCTGDEDCLSMCQGSEHTGDCQRFAAVTCNAPQGTVRLAGGPNAYTGRVEIFANGTWGVVCDDEWNINAGHVVCRQLGFSKAFSVQYAAAFGTGNGPILLDDVRCSGREADLLACRHNEIGEHNCIPEEAAGVTCKCTYRKQKTVTRTKVISYRTQTNNWCWSGRCISYQLAYKKQSYPAQITSEEDRCCKIDGGWGEWKVDECSVSCGGGVQMLRRACDNPRPFCRGRSCIGPLIITRHCNTDPCPSVFGDWGVYDDCSVSCGGGTQLRNRTCVSGQCQEEDLVEVRNCNMQCCPVSGGWSEWSNGSCSEPCGGGVMNMSRSCDSPAPSCGGDNCNGLSYDEVPCNEEPCEPAFLMSNWTEFSECSKPCGNGSMTRNRTCLEGSCTEPLTDSVPCNVECCPVDGGWSLWTPTDCSTTCGGGTMNASRVCNSPPPSCGGANCTGASFLFRRCNIQPCPQVYSDWSGWSQCSAACGGGRQFRNRTCLSGNCVGDVFQTEKCNEEPCEGEYGNWTEATSCTVTCGGGSQLFTRECLSGPCNETSETRLCGLICCPVDGEWSDYTPVGTCSQTCGIGGKVKKMRTCSNPTPACGGKECVGCVMKIDDCHQPNCPSPEVNETGVVDDLEDNKLVVPDITNGTHNVTDDDGSGNEYVSPDDEEDLNITIGAWNEFGNCSLTCGGGTQVRTRSCSGDGCDNVTTVDIRECNSHCCPVDGGWTEFQSEGPCSVTCGSGTKSYSRYCTKPEPVCGGKACDGPVMELRSCDLAPCPTLPDRSFSPAEVAAVFMSMQLQKSSSFQGTVRFRK